MNEKMKQKDEKNFALQAANEAQQELIAKLKAMLDKSDGLKDMSDAHSTVMSTPPQVLDQTGVTVKNATGQEKKQERKET